MPPVKVPKDTKAEGCETTHCLPRFVRRSIAETCAGTGPRKKGTGIIHEELFQKNARTHARTLKRADA
jgi:hypothetical protein